MNKFQGAAFCLAAALLLILSPSGWGYDKEYEDSTVDGHAIEEDGGNHSYTNVGVYKTGDSSYDEEADFYGYNAAVLASGKATLTLMGSGIFSDGRHANAVFSYGGGSGDGTTVNVSDSTIITSGDYSGGLMTAGGGIMNASNLTINTAGDSSAAIRSDRGGGTVAVSGGTYTTSGSGSPVVYSTADVTVSNAALESKAAQGVVVEGKNSVTLNDCALTANNNTLHGDSTTYQAVMLYQSMSGDADTGASKYTMTNGSITNEKGDIFYVTNTSSVITLTNVAIKNNDSSGKFLTAAAGPWGASGSNGGDVTLTASNQIINGNMVVDSVSSLDMTLKDGSTFNGAINSGDANGGAVSVTVENGSTWNMTGSSYVTSLTASPDDIERNGHTLYVDGKVYGGGESDGDEDDDDDDDDTGAPVITTASLLPSGKVGTAYSAALKASGAKPITWSRSGDNKLPDGLSLNRSTGLISGTPTAAGTFSFTIMASNRERSTTKTFSISISALSSSGGGGGCDAGFGGLALALLASLFIPFKK